MNSKFNLNELRCIKEKGFKSTYNAVKHASHFYLSLALAAKAGILSKTLNKDQGKWIGFK
jgi:hypothetical protein